MFRETHRTATMLGSILVLFIAMRAGAQVDPLYQLEILPTDTGEKGRANAVETLGVDGQDGLAAGGWTIGSSHVTMPAYWERGVNTDWTLTLLEDWASRGGEVNRIGRDPALGHISSACGFVRGPAQVPLAALWGRSSANDPFTLVTLPLIDPFHPRSEAIGMDPTAPRGLLCGWSEKEVSGSVFQHAVVWQEDTAGVWTIETLPGPSPDRDYAANDVGLMPNGDLWAVGWMIDAAGNRVPMRWRWVDAAGHWEWGLLPTLGGDAGQINAWMFGEDGTRHAVGTTEDASGSPHATLWKETDADSGNFNVFDLGIPSGFTESAGRFLERFSDSFQYVGYAQNASNRRAINIDGGNSEIYFVKQRLVDRPSFRIIQCKAIAKMGADPLDGPAVLAGYGEFINGPAGDQPFVVVQNATPTDLSIESGTILFGTVASVHTSEDGDELSTRSGFGATLIDLHNMEVEVVAATDLSSPAEIDLTFKNRIDEPAGTAQVRLLNHTTGAFDLVGTYVLGNTDQLNSIENIAAAEYVDANGRITLSIKHLVFVPFVAFTFDSFIDRVQVGVW